MNPHVFTSIALEKPPDKNDPDFDKKFADFSNRQILAILHLFEQQLKECVEISDGYFRWKMMQERFPKNNPPYEDWRLKLFGEQAKKKLLGLQEFLTPKEVVG